MNEYAAIMLMMNNYFHDVATAMLLASAYAMWALLGRLAPDAGPGAVRYFIKIYKKITGLAWFSLAWILICGVPRVMFYKEFEWSHMAGRGQVPALIVKHILAFALVTGGVLLWTKVKRRVVKLEEKLGAEQT